MKDTPKQTRVTTDELLDMREAVFRMRRRAQGLSQVSVYEGLRPIEDQLHNIARHTALQEAEARRSIGVSGDG